MDELPKGLTRVLEASGLDENEMLMQCFNNCSENEDCQSWTLDVESKKCYQYDDHVRLNGHQDGFYSGVKVYHSLHSRVNVLHFRKNCCLYKLLINYDHNVWIHAILQTHWSIDSECLTVDRNTPGYSTNGNMSLCAYSSDKNVSK